MGEEITEVLEYEPGELFVKKYVRPKYAMPQNSGVIIGELPVRPLEKAMAGEGLLAQIIIDKMTNRSKGFGFVEMSSEAEALKAIEMFHDQDFQGRRLTVNVARPLAPREDRPRRTF